MSTSSKNANQATRSANRCPVFGLPQNLTEMNMPTYRDVMKHYTYVRLEHSNKMNSKEQPSVTEVASIVAKKLEAIWQKASIPTVSRTRIVQQVKNYHDKHRNLLKPYRTRKNNVKYKARIAKFQHEAESLFDISACKCKEEAVCNCPKELKVSKNEKAFLVDQRSSRKMIIGNIDRKKTAQLQKRNKRKQLDTIRKSKHAKTEEGDSSIETGCLDLTENDNNISSGEEEEDSNTDEPPSTKASSQIECNQNAQNRMSLPTVAKICDPFSVSDRAGASIASAVLKDYGIVHGKNKNLIIGRSKVKREREKERRHNQSFQTPSSVQGLYFDGKKDSTLTPQKSGVGTHFVREEHITLVAEPGSNYVGHFTPNCGKAKDISEGLLEFCSSHDLDLYSLNVIG